MPKRLILSASAYTVTHVTFVTRAAMMSPMSLPSLTLERLELTALADGQVLLGRELTESERRVIIHTVHTMHGIMSNLIDRNIALAALVDTYEYGHDGDANGEMDVVA